MESVETLKAERAVIDSELRNTTVDMKVINIKRTVTKHWKGTVSIISIDPTCKDLQVYPWNPYPINNVEDTVVFVTGKVKPILFLHCFLYTRKVTFSENLQIK